MDYDSHTKDRIQNDVLKIKYCPVKEKSPAVHTSGLVRSFC